MRICSLYAWCQVDLGGPNIQVGRVVGGRNAGRLTFLHCDIRIVLQLECYAQVKRRLRFKTWSVLSSHEDAYFISVVTCFVHRGFCTWGYAPTGIDIYLHIRRKCFLCSTYILHFKEDLPQRHRALSAGSDEQVCDGWRKVTHVSQADGPKLNHTNLTINFYK